MEKFLKFLYPCITWIALLLVVTSCDSGSDASAFGSLVAIEESSMDGMLYVHSTGGFAILGTNNKKAKSIEKSQVRVNFDYDFYIGRSEVTCREFKELVSDYEISVSCENDNFPVTDITYYDAVVFANAKSKKEKKDTAYSYASVIYKSGHVSDLEGFVFHPEKEAFRLPTEAEWILVASKDWYPVNSWNSENSEYKIHEVCALQQDSAGICDMAGNALEWVNDWLGNFTDTTLSNYGGAPDGGNLGQRVLKGGCYRDAPQDMKLYSRGDVYTVVSGARKEYIGFRLAYGAIPDVQWMDYRKGASSSRIIPLASPTAIRQLTGTYQTKIAFRNEESGNLSVIDYSSGVASFMEIQDTIPVYHPVISPDGQKVAFSTGTEGVSGKSAVYVRDLNFSGSNLVKLDVESAAIPRWMILEGDTSIVYVTDAGNNEDSQTFMEQSTWSVVFKGGKFGTPHKIFDGAYHSGVDVAKSFAVSGARKLRVHTAGTDTIWYDGNQACNASLSKDGLRKTLFLDFGSGKRSEYKGESYGVHERILVVDSLGRLVDYFTSPSNYAFDHTEWAMDGLIVASLTNVNGAHEKIAIVNSRDSSITEVAEGNELWHPDLWFKNQAPPSDETTLDLDSAGVYYSVGAPFFGLDLRVKMESFWTRKDEVSVIALGSSRVMFGVNEKLFKSGGLLNMGFPSGDFSGMLYLFKNYVLNHTNVKTVVIEFSPDIFISDDNSSWNLIYQVVPGFRYDENHDFWPEGVSDAFVISVKDSYKPTDSLSLPYSYDDIYLPSGGWGPPVYYRNPELVYRENEVNIMANLLRLNQICQMTKERGIRLIALIPPQNPKYTQTDAFGIYGMGRKDALFLIEKIQEMDLVLMDENKMGFHDYDNDMAYNTDHLSRAGAAQLTRRLDSLIQSLDKMQ